MSRKFKVWFTKRDDEIVAYFVTDQTEEEQRKSKKKFEAGNDLYKFRHACQEEVRPRVATFPVSPLYPEDEQENRAQMLCDYMNKIQEAKDHAASQTALVDLLTAQPPTNP